MNNQQPFQRLSLKEVRPLTNSELLELDADALIPAANGNVINKENADSITAYLIVEGLTDRSQAKRLTYSKNMLYQLSRIYWQAQAV